MIALIVVDRCVIIPFLTRSAGRNSYASTTVVNLLRSVSVVHSASSRSISLETTLFTNFVVDNLQAIHEQKIRMRRLRNIIGVSRVHYL